MSKPKPFHATVRSIVPTQGGTRLIVVTKGKSQWSLSVARHVDIREGMSLLVADLGAGRVQLA